MLPIFEVFYVHKTDSGEAAEKCFRGRHEYDVCLNYVNT